DPGASTIAMTLNTPMSAARSVPLTVDITKDPPGAACDCLAVGYRSCANGKPTFEECRETFDDSALVAPFAPQGPRPSSRAPGSALPKCSCLRARRDCDARGVHTLRSMSHAIVEIDVTDAVP